MCGSPNYDNNCGVVGRIFYCTKCYTDYNNFKPYIFADPNVRTESKKTRSKYNIVAYNKTINQVTR